MKVCFVGNSHLAAFKTAWVDRGSVLSNANADFFGAAGGGFSKLRRAGNVLLSSDESIVQQMSFTSGGKTRILIDEYDAFVLVAMGHGLVKHLNTCADHRTFAMPPAGHLISEQFFSKCIHRLTRWGLAARLATEIRAVSDKPIILCEQPLPRRIAAERGEAPWTEIERVAPAVVPVYCQAVRILERTLSLRSVSQPARTTVGRYFTSDEFGRNAKRLLSASDPTYREDDWKHMNAAFGLEYLREIDTFLNVSGSLAAFRTLFEGVRARIAPSQKTKRARVEQIDKRVERGQEHYR